MLTSRLVAVVATLTGAGVALPGSAAAAPVPSSCASRMTPGCLTRQGDELLSDETTFTTWAGAPHRSPVRQQPFSRARRTATLHHLTADALPEVYVLLRQRQVGPTVWVQIRLPLRPGGRTGWVPRTALGRSHQVSTEIIVSRVQHRLWLVRSGALIFETPVGHFWVREAFPVPADAPAYGPFAIGTSAYSVLPNWPGGGVVGIHGTNQPALVPGRASYGCIVLRNERMAALAPLVPLGTPVLIH